MPRGLTINRGILQSFRHQSGSNQAASHHLRLGFRRARRISFFSSEVLVFNIPLLCWSIRHNCAQLLPSGLAYSRSHPRRTKEVEAQCLVMPLKKKGSKIQNMQHRVLAAARPMMQVSTKQLEAVRSRAPAVYRWRTSDNSALCF